LNSYILPSRLWLDSNHFIISSAIILLGLFGLSQLWNGSKEKVLVKYLLWSLAGMIALTLLSGLMILFKISFLSGIAYNLYDLMLAGILFAAIVIAANYQIRSIAK
jgi:hypothetical protein